MCVGHENEMSRVVALLAAAQRADLAVFARGLGGPLRHSSWASTSAAMARCPFGARSRWEYVCSMPFPSRFPDGDSGVVSARDASGKPIRHQVHGEWDQIVNSIIRPTGIVFLFSANVDPRSMGILRLLVSNLCAWPDIDSRFFHNLEDYVLLHESICLVLHVATRACVGKTTQPRTSPYLKVMIIYSIHSFVRISRYLGMHRMGVAERRRHQPVAGAYGGGLEVLAYCRRSSERARSGGGCDGR